MKLLLTLWLLCLPALAADPEVRVRSAWCRRARS
jgi:hypothetical protein